MIFSSHQKPTASCLFLPIRTSTRCSADSKSFSLPRVIQVSYRCTRTRELFFQNMKYPVKLEGKVENHLLPTRELSASLSQQCQYDKRNRIRRPEYLMEILLP